MDDQVSFDEETRISQVREQRRKRLIKDKKTQQTKDDETSSIFAKFGLVLLGFFLIILCV